MEFVKVLKKLGYIRREIASAEIFDTSLITGYIPKKTTTKTDQQHRPLT